MLRTHRFASIEVGLLVGNIGKSAYANI